MKICIEHAHYAPDMINETYSSTILDFKDEKTRYFGYLVRQNK